MRGHVLAMVAVIIGAAVGAPSAAAQPTIPKERIPAEATAAVR